MCEHIIDNTYYILDVWQVEKFQAAKQHKWPSRSLKVTGIGAIQKANTISYSS